MRRVGLVLLAVGLAGFFFASTQRVQAEKATRGTSAESSVRARRASERWETTRWLLLGAAVMGLVFTILPGKET